MNKSRNNNENPFSSKDKEKLKGMPDVIKKSISWCLKNAFSTALFLKLIENGMNPFQAKKFLAERAVWLRTNSIIWNPLYYPDSWDNEGKLRFQNAPAWLWNVYDFRKKFKQRLIHPYSHLWEWVDLAFFPIDENIVNYDSDINRETPEWYFDLFNFDHLIWFSKFRVQEALDYWAIEEVTYKEAYNKLWVKSWKEDVSKLWIGEKTVYQVTPKWNTLIFAWKKWGDKTPPLSDFEKGKPWEPQVGYA